MPACAFTSKSGVRASHLERFSAWGLGFCASVGLLVLVAVQTSTTACAAEPGAPPSTQRTDQPEEPDLKGSPYTEYGEFDERDEEDEVTRFLQYGRFFGVSLGGGLSGATGNRGSLYQGGFPSFELKLHYWFDFNFAVEMALNVNSHFFETQARGAVDTTLLRTGLDLKYYIPVFNLAAPISFANPYLTLGFGSFQKTDRFQREETVDNDSSVGLTVGAGLEFVMSPRRSSFYISGKASSVTFKDSQTADYEAEGFPNLSGLFYTLTAGFLFTW